MTGDGWMRPALDALIARVDDVSARAALVTAPAFAEIRALVDEDKTLDVPVGDRGDNLLKALLALRVKFPPEEARAKLESNLAMRRPSHSAQDAS